MTNTTKSISKDAVKSRLYASGIWKLKSVAHFGGDETGVADMCLLRDADGNPFIPGTSIAGAARSFLAQLCLPWATYKNGITEETPELKRLFGGGEIPNSKKPGTMSALIIADAPCVSEEVKPVRDGVRIDAKSGTALDKAKFDVEVVERDTEFKIELECIIRKADAEQEKELRSLFSALLHAFKQGDIRLGARTRRGYGRGKVDAWDIRDMLMNDPNHVMAWLSGDVWEYDQQGTKLTPKPLATEERRFFRIEADFALRTSLLIRSASNNPDDPDMAHLHSKDEPVIPGTSFAGAFRHRATLIAHILEWQTHRNGQDAVSEMFGAVHKQEDDSNDSNQTDPWASRVFIEERLVENVKPQWQDRVAIDRFTGGSLQSALFNEKPVYPCPIKAEPVTNVRLRLTLEEPEKAEIGLLLLTLRDFWYGNAALGGETSNGRGTLQGIKAKLIYKDDPDPSNTKEWTLVHKDKRMKIENNDGDFLQCCVGAAQNYKDRPKASRRPNRNGKEETGAE